MYYFNRVSDFYGISFNSFSGGISLRVKQQQCIICHGELCDEEVTALIKNDDCCMRLLGVTWLLCDLCEHYCHFKCYAQRQGLSIDEAISDEEYIWKEPPHLKSM